MSESQNEIIPVTIEDELKQSYLDYAMSVIVGRALPDARDGLKPVHRRVLYAMSQLNNDYNKPYKKSARIVGDVIGKYHPHGDTAVYDTIVRMAQPFSMRYLLVDGQGNFGSVDGDAPAAMRYTEVRMSRFAHTLLADLEKNTVDFDPNYDETELIPSVLPTRVPNLLVNGSSGIAVGMATNIPPHNLGEVIDACLALVANPNLSIEELLSYVPGPDFPTAGIINGRSGIIQAYKTGRGRVLLRARAHIESAERENHKTSIIVTELPYQVNKAKLQEKIAELVRNKKIEGITAIRDESDKEGMRVVIEVRRGENAEVVLNNLYAHTALQNVFGINMVTLEEGEPKLLNLKQLLQAFIRHRREVVVRRTLFELKKARERAHVLEGLAVALANIDEVIAIVKTSPTPMEAKTRLLTKVWSLGEMLPLLNTLDIAIARPEDLMAHYGLKDQTYALSPVQAQAILDLRLHRLTGLERDKVMGEYKNLLNAILDYLLILKEPDELMKVICEELEEVKKQFADTRRTEIIDSQMDLTNEDLIPETELVVTLSQHGYAKSQPLDSYQAQKRGGKGKTATKLKEEDIIEHLVIAHSHDTLLCFTDRGKVYWIKTYAIPQASRTSRGRPLINLLPLSDNERVTALLSVCEFTTGEQVFMATARGIVKKVPLEQFSRPRTNGIIAIALKPDDQLIGVALTSGMDEVMLFSDEGKAVRFSEGEVRPMGRTACGVRGIKLSYHQKVISLIILKSGQTILSVTEQGYGKRTAPEEFRRTARGGQGVIAIQVNERNGKMVNACQVSEDDEVLLLSSQGSLIRTRVNEISQLGRNTQGVRLINLNECETLAGLQPVSDIDKDAIEG